jgi:hypothetical protein
MTESADSIKQAKAAEESYNFNILMWKTGGRQRKHDILRLYLKEDFNSK